MTGTMHIFARFKSGTVFHEERGEMVLAGMIARAQTMFGTSFDLGRAVAVHGVEAFSRSKLPLSGGSFLLTKQN